MPLWCLDVPIRPSDAQHLLEGTDVVVVGTAARRRTADPGTRPFAVIPLLDLDVIDGFQGGQLLAQGRVGDLDHVPKRTELDVLDRDERRHDAQPYGTAQLGIQSVPGMAVRHAGHDRRISLAPTASAGSETISPA